MKAPTNQHDDTPYVSSDERVDRFAHACYDTNSTDELLEALKCHADATDCREWGLTPGEWEQAVRIALQWKQDESDEPLEKRYK
jgi:hypothetical protein